MLLALICALVTVLLLCYILNFIFKIFHSIDDFAQAAHYRDFSKRYPESKRRQNTFFHHFNVISDVFLALNREKEVQQHYLKRMLELVDTGILAYELESHDVLWVNDALLTMFKIPPLKNIHWLKTRNVKLYHELLDIPLGESRLITINAGNQVIKTLTKASTFQTGSKTYKLIAFHNISATLEDVEAGAWKGLLNVMTHEIMNSIAPVASLADTLKKRMGNIKQVLGDASPPDMEDIEFAMDTIHRRSEGLLRFSDTYRSLSKTIIPELQTTNLYRMIQSVYQLMYPSLQQKNITLETKTDDSTVTAFIDSNLIEQVLINFITNAAYAVKDKSEPHIILFSGKTMEGFPYLTVADNGNGISSENRDKIFIPFFSTKKSGSGIGLSLSREIVKIHKGSIEIQSKEGEGSAFTVLFRGSD
jgi:nitrogen fixation/metabolism regulation signal transduction histidine kinase